jgi:hypothetical protein
VQAARSQNDDIARSLYCVLHRNLVLDEVISIAVPQAFIDGNVDSCFLLDKLSHLGNVLGINRYPLAATWTVVDVDGVHPEMFLVATGVHVLHLHVHLGESDTKNVLSQV